MLSRQAYLLATLAMSWAGCSEIGSGDGPKEDTADAAVQRDGSTSGTPDAAPASSGDRPTIRASYTLTDWVYLEWDIVDDATSYTQLVITDVGPSAKKVGPGSNDRGEFRYIYFHRTEVCAVIADEPAAAHSLRVKVMPATDEARAEMADTEGTLNCP